MDEEHLTWDPRNRMATYDNYDTFASASYSYDNDGVRVGESSEANVIYLNDLNNPTGYTKAVEEKSSLNATSATRNYLLGLRVEAQRDTSSATVPVVYLLTDGHGSTRTLINAPFSGSAITQSYDYDGYGSLLGADASGQRTP